MSKIGLVPNTSKTAIIPKDEFRKQHHEDHNEYLDQIHDMTAQGTPPSPDDLKVFKRKLVGFLSSEREGYWSRVLRRYYTESRRMRSKTLLVHWDVHLKEFPADAASILDFVSFFPGSISFCDTLFSYLKSHGPLFEDLQILAYESLLLRPFPNDPLLRGFIVRQTYKHYAGTSGFTRPSPYVQGLQALTIYKFGGPRSVGLLAKDFPGLAVESPIFATYAFPVLAASATQQQLAFTGVEHIEDSRILRIRALIERLERGEDRAIGLLLGLLEPKRTTLPERLIVNPRVLPFLPIALRSPNTQQGKRLRDSMNRVAKKVSTVGDPDLVDAVTLSHLS